MTGHLTTEHLTEEEKQSFRKLREAHDAHLRGEITTEEALNRIRRVVEEDDMRRLAERLR